MFFKKLKERNRNKKINTKLKEYPCENYLHNALYFLSADKPDAAYMEICFAICKSGGTLIEREKERFDILAEQQFGGEK